MPARIEEVEVENFKRIVHCKLVLGERVLEVIGGKNKAGKSSLIDAFVVGLTGKTAEPPVVMREGADFTRVKLKTSPDLGLEVDREWRRTRDGARSRLVVRQHGERVKKSPETFLQSFWSAAGAVRPGEFIDMGDTPEGRRKQAKTLCDLVGLDWTELDREYGAIYEDRATVNRKVSDLEGQLKGLPTYEDAPAKRVEVRELTAQLAAQQQHNAGKYDLQRAVKEARDEIEANRHGIENADATIADLQKRIAKIEAMKGEYERRKEAAQVEAEKAQENLAAFQPEDEQSTIRAIEEAEGINRKVDGRARYHETRQMLTAATEQAARMTERLKAIQAEKEAQLAAADLPEGLGFDADGITFNGLPFKNASAREQWEAALAVAFRQAAQIGLVIADDRFDYEAMAELQRRAAEHGAVVVIERVPRHAGDTEGCTILVEDGHAEVLP
jgi:DNA repair exonuclease SbcCD ATPase subunit